MEKNWDRICCHFMRHSLVGWLFKFTPDSLGLLSGRFVHVVPFRLRDSFETIHEFGRNQSINSLPLSTQHSRFSRALAAASWLCLCCWSRRVIILLKYWTRGNFLSFCRARRDRPLGYSGQPTPAERLQGFIHFFFLFIFFSIFSFFFFFCQSTHFVNSQNMMLSICLFIYSFLLKVRGDLVLNGLTTSCVDLAERVAYIQKDCNLCGDMTVRQTLLFTALLQAPGRPNRNVDTKGRVRAPPSPLSLFPALFPIPPLQILHFPGIKNLFIRLEK